MFECVSTIFSQRWDSGNESCLNPPPSCLCLSPEEFFFRVLVDTALTLFTIIWVVSVFIDLVGKVLILFYAPGAVFLCFAYPVF